MHHTNPFYIFESFTVITFTISSFHAENQNVIESVFQDAHQKSKENIDVTQSSVQNLVVFSLTKSIPIEMENQSLLPFKIYQIPNI